MKFKHLCYSKTNSHSKNRIYQKISSNIYLYPKKKLDLFLKNMLFII